MRHTRVRRRFKLILIALLAGTFVLFLESRIESFAPQLKGFAESKIGEALDKRFKVSIGSLGGGIVHPLMLNDCTITDDKGRSVFPSLEISQILSDYKVWDFFFKKKDVWLFSNLLAKEPLIDIKFASKNKALSGFMRLEGNIDDARIRGYVNILEKERIDFTGTVKGQSFELELKAARGILKATGTISSDGSLEAAFKISHLKVFKNTDIVCDAVLWNRIAVDPNDPAKSSIEGELETRNLVINHKPFSNLKSHYSISGKTLYVSSLELGSDFKISGNVILKVPYNIDIVIMANNVSMSRILTSITSQEILLTGTMNGKFELKGPCANPRLTAVMDIKKGSIAKVDFEHLTASFKGDLPIIRIEDSRITRESGYFVLTGEMDLSKSTKGMFEGIKIAGTDTAVLWDGWDTTKLKNVEAVKMTKKISDDFDLGFKKYIADEKVDESLRYADEYELEYNLNPNESLKFRIGQDQDFFGLEHKNKF